MRETSCVITMQFADITAQADASYSANDAQTMSDYILTDSTAESSLATSELNQFVLDGTMPFAEDTTKVGWYTSEMSGEDCTFTTNPVLTIAFDDTHSSSGLTLKFDDYAPRKVKVEYLSNGYLLKSYTYENEDYTSEIYVKGKAINYNGIKLTILETLFPQSIVKLRYILYGKVVVWGDTVIKDASIKGDIDVTSTTLSINTGTISIIDTANDFDLADTDGDWNLIQGGQPFFITGYVDGVEKDLGTMYVKSFTNKKNIVTFSIQDAIALIDKENFYKGTFYTDMNAGELIEEIFSDAGFEDYEIASEIYEEKVSGYLALQTHRKALQQILFAIGAVADTSFSDKIKIYMPKIEPSAFIRKDRKFDSTTISLGSYVSSVSSGYKRYEVSTSTSKAYEGYLYAGTHLITFSKPYTNYVVTGGELLDSGTNYAKISVATEGTITIQANGYTESTDTYTMQAETLDANEPLNEKSFTNMTLISDANTKNKQLLKEYKLRKNVSVKFQSEGECVGDWVRIEQRDYPNNYIVTKIKSQTIDLTGGFISTASCVGWDNEETLYAYAGEIYAGEREVI